MYLSGVRQLCRQILQDEMDSDAGGEIFQDDELDLHITNAVRKLASYSPVESKEELTASGTDELDLSSISGLRRVIKAEYPVGNSPRTFVNFTLFGDSLILSEEVGDGESVYVYCTMDHTLTEASTTLSNRETDLVITGACGLAAMSKSMKYLNRVNVGGANMYGAMHSWGERMYNEFLKQARNIRRTRLESIYEV
jgi:hypothetical protein